MSVNETVQAGGAQRFKPEPRDELAGFDPHLQEVILASEVNQDPNPAIVSNGRLDVIARLNDTTRVEGRLPQTFEKGREIGDIITGSLPVQDIPTARKHPNIASLKAATELYANLHHSVPDIGCDTASLQQELPRYPGLDGSGVIIGIVDTGCDFAHPNFLLPRQVTRLLYLWDQNDGQANPMKAEAPKGFAYGREFDATKINEALLKDDPYTALGYTPEPAAHGTHVMDIAAGNGRAPKAAANPVSTPAGNAAPGVAPNARIIFVNLKTDNPASLGNSRHLLDAVDYIFQKAEDLSTHDGKTPPVVVNLSISTAGGPHDGTTLIEKGFERLLEKAGRAIVISAGNAFKQEGHVMGTIPKDGHYTMQWQTDSIAKRNELEIWYDGEPHLEVTLVSPHKQKLGPYGPGQTVDLKDTSGVRQGRISHRKDDPNNHANQIDIRVPFAEEPWTIELKNSGEEVSFHAWIEQGDRGRSRFLTDTSSAYTLGAISCGQSTIAVGAYDTYENACLAPLYEATAAGPTRDGREKPDVSAPGVRITAARSLGSTIQISGTSMAAPHVTGLVALLFQLAERAGLGPLDAKTIQALVRETARRNPPTTQGWDSRYGAGRLAGPESLASLLKRPPSAVVANIKPGPSVTTETAPRTKAKAHGNGDNSTQNLDLDQVVQFLRNQLAGNGNNGSHDLSAFVQTVAAKIQKQEGFRLRVEPLI